MSEEKKAIQAFIGKWLQERGKIMTLGSYFSPEEAIECQNAWMQSEEFGHLYGWRLVPQNPEQAKIWDRLQEDRRQRERDDAILISELPPK